MILIPRPLLKRIVDAAEAAYPEECWHCKACVDICPEEDAIRLRIPMPMMVCYK